MENSSKALLIAAAVLIVILLIAFSIRIFNSTDSVKEQATGVGESITSATKDAVTELKSSFDKTGVGGTSLGTGTSTGEIPSIQEGNTPTYVESTWKDNGNGTFSKGTITVKIGDYVNYNEGSSTHTPDTAKGAGTSQTGGNLNAGYTLGTNKLTTEDLKWRVLGLNEKGQIVLISADPTTQTLYLANDKGYANAEDNLNNFCNDLYGKGEYATGARSLNVEDINKLTNYNPTSSSSYGEKWIYRYPTQEEMDAFKGTENSTRYMQYSKNGGTTWGNISSSSYQTFRLPNEEAAISSSNSGSKELESTSYSYSIASNLTTDDGFTSDEATAISNMICKGTTSSNRTQWLASRCVYCGSGNATFFVRLVIGGSVKYDYLFNSNERFNYNDYRVRPVVSLKSDINITGTGDNIGTEGNMWNIG